MNRVAPIILAIFGSAVFWQAAKPSSAPGIGVTVYDPDPAHEWNRLYTALMVREDRSGRHFGIDSIDPLLWTASTHLLEPKSHRTVIRALDEFLQTHAENRIRDPLRRALFIRDLWAVFDWSVARQPFAQGEPEYAPEKRALQLRLAELMRRLALSSREIASLPDNYQQAVASGAFAKEFDPEHPDRPFLPPALFDQHGPWVKLDGILDGPAAPQPAALQHVYSVSGRSRFLVFLRLPEGRKATFDYIHQLWNFPQSWVLRKDAPLHSEVNPALPSFPPGTEVALVRQTMMFDNTANLRPGPITESVQIRVYQTVSGPPPDEPGGFEFEASGSGQKFYELRLNRSLLFSGKSGGLREIGREEMEPLLFSAMPGDQIEDPAFSDNWNKMIPVLQECVMCHRSAGINSLNSRAVLLKPNLLQHDAGYELPPDWWKNDETISWKQQRYDWGLLNGYWKSSRSQ